MDITEVFKRSWRIFWNNKVLWLVGIIAAFFGASDYKVNFNSNSNFQTGGGGMSGGGPGGIPEDIPPEVERYFYKVVEFVESPEFWVVIGLLTLLGVLVAVVFAVLGRGFRGAMVYMAHDADKNGTTSFSNGMLAFRTKTVPLVGIGVLLWLPTFLIMLLASIPFFISLFSIIASAEGDTPDLMEALSASGFFLGIGACCTGLCLSALLGIVLSVLDKYAIRACVLEDRGVIESIKLGWLVLTKNVGYTVLLWFIFAAMAFGFGMVVMIPGMLIMVGMFGVVMSQGMVPMFFGLGVVLVIYAFLVNVVLGGIATSFNETTWTIGYKEFREQMALE